MGKNIDKTAFLRIIKLLLTHKVVLISDLLIFFASDFRLFSLKSIIKQNLTKRFYKIDINFTSYRCLCSLA